MSNKIESGILTKTKERRERRKMRLRTNNIIKLSMPHHDYSVSLERKYFKAWSVHSFYEITRQLIEVKK